jgi:AraC-like DNA-binding protein
VTVDMQDHPVHPALAPYVTCIWSLESDGALLDAGRERILPDGCVELVFHFRDAYLTHFASGETARQPASFVVGQMRRFLEIEPAGRAGFVAVRFRARGAHLFFDRPLSEVASGVVDLGDVWRERAAEWTERVALAPSLGARVRLVEEALLGLLGRAGRTDAAVDRALHLIEARCGRIRVDALAAEIGVSCRHLGRRFQRVVGVGPKEFGRLCRFRHALVRMTSGRSLTETALLCGYFDQAHFNHEFQEIAGMSPGRLATFPHVAF